MLLPITCIAFPSTMILTCPFVRWTFENHPTKACDVGGYYYLLTTQTHKEIAAVSCPREDGRMVFKPHDTFIECYAPHLILGGELEWESEDNLVVWPNAVVHNSFMYNSTAGIHFVLGWLKIHVFQIIML